jgi:hypothetical protein
MERDRRCYVSSCDEVADISLTLGRETISGITREPTRIWCCAQHGLEIQRCHEDGIYLTLSGAFVLRDGSTPASLMKSARASF